MRVFRVVTEKGGETTKEHTLDGGKISTEIVRVDRRFAAESISDVWNALDDFVDQDTEHLIGVFEEHPAITVLRSAK